MKPFFLKSEEEESIRSDQSIESMAMAMRLPAISRAVTEVASASASAPVGLRRLFCSNASRFSFLSPQAESQTPARPQAEPSTNLFVSGNKPRLVSQFISGFYRCSSLCGFLFDAFFKILPLELRFRLSGS